MDQPRFEDLVRRMEQLAQASPRAYRWRIYALAALGFASLALLVVTLLALLAVAAGIAREAPGAAIKLGVVAGALLLVVLRALWVRLRPPEGAALARSDAPALFDLLERLCARLDTPRVHQVLISEDFNAGVTQVPRLGVFGWHRNYLLLGLPLLRSLSVPQLEAVLAHELGHLSRGHARVGNWIYRLRLTWARLDAGLARRPQWGSGAIRAFLHWYAPYFNACSFPLARRNEFEADATSAQLTSVAVAAQALTNTSVVGHYLQSRYWPAIRAGARVTPRPAAAPFSAFTAPGSGESGSTEMQSLLHWALAQPATLGDTHPSLSERLQALGAEAQIALPSRDTAADRLLGAHAGSLARAFDERWCRRVEQPWKQEYERAQQQGVRLAQLREQSARGALPTPEALEYADLEEAFGDPAGALALRREIVARDPGSAPARFGLARQLLLAAEEAGVPLMEGVIEAEPDAILPGSQLLHQYWWRRGQSDKARHWQQRALERQRTIEAGKRERARIVPGDVWLPHGLDETVLQALVARLKEVRGLRRAYLVRKRLVHQPERPLYVLGFKASTLGLSRTGKTAAVLGELRRQVQFPGETLIACMDNPNRALARTLRAMRPARIL